jgi:hypothetical protein
LVTTYQAGKLVILRPDGDRLNTHFRGFSKPMGLAVDGARIFAMQVLPGVRHPDVINEQPRVIADSFVVPDEALDLVPEPLRHAAGVTQEPSNLEEIVR